MIAEDAPRDENAALQWAVEHFRGVIDYLMPGGTHKQDLDKNIKMLRAGGEFFDGYDDISEYIKIARQGDHAANTVLLETAASWIAQGIPARYWGPLREFIVEFLRNPQQVTRTRGRKRSTLSQRDLFIAFAVRQIHLRWGIPKTRNVASRNGGRHSATSIVKQALESVALNLSEDDVAKIWGAEQKRMDRWKESRGIK
jgi:hypothetical protein